MFSQFLKVIFLILILICSTFTGCGNKTEQAGDKKQPDNKSSTLNSDLVIKDDKGTKVSLVLKPKKGEVFKYKMNAKTSSKEMSPLTGNKEVTSTQDINYFYTEEVNDVASSGIITYKLKFDSIDIVSTASSIDSSLSMTYNSNIKDSVYSKPCIAATHVVDRHDHGYRYLCSFFTARGFSGIRGSAKDLLSLANGHAVELLHLNPVD